MISKLSYSTSKFFQLYCQLEFMLRHILRTEILVLLIAGLVCSKFVLASNNRTVLSNDELYFLRGDQRLKFPMDAEKYAALMQQAASTKKNELDRLILLHPKQAKLYVLRSNCWRVMRQYDKALVDASNAIRLDSNYASAYFIRGCAYQCKKQHSLAKKDFQQGLKLGDKRCKVPLELME